MVLSRCPANKREAAGRGGELRSPHPAQLSGLQAHLSCLSVCLPPLGLSVKPSDLERPPETSVCAQITSGLSDQTNALGKKGINEQHEDPETPPAKPSFLSTYSWDETCANICCLCHLTESLQLYMVRD